MRTATAVARRTATVPPATAAPTAPAHRTRTVRGRRTRTTAAAARRTILPVGLLTPTHMAAPLPAKPAMAQRIRTTMGRPRTIPLTPTTDIIRQPPTTGTIRPHRIIRPVTTAVRLRPQPQLELWSAWLPEQP